VPQKFSAKELPTVSVNLEGLQVEANLELDRHQPCTLERTV